jgi:hypothetical protein
MNILHIYFHFRNKKPVVIQSFGLEAFQKSAISVLAPRKLYEDIVWRHSWRYCLTHADSVAAENAFHARQLMPEVCHSKI